MTIRSFWDFLRRAGQAYAACQKPLLREFSLTAAEADVLMFLANNPSCDTAAQISSIRRIPKSQVSLSVHSLADRGLLTCEMRGGNRKSVHLAPSPDAAPVIARGHAVQQSFAEVLFAGFTEAEKAEFSRLHDKLAANLANIGDDLSCRP